ncbi:MAG: hypothetical protein IIX28_03430 [Clostridia bacterium]|nr:hypothetical protein [Clostridia bacterium]
MKRFYSIFMAAVLLLGLTACGDKTPVKQPDPKQEPLVYTELPTALTAEKLGTIGRQVISAEGGLYYKEGDRYGIMSFDGSYDSGAVYTMCEPRGALFLVSTADMATTLTAANVTQCNRVGMVDGEGNELIPLEYSSVEILGDRFARATEVEAVTDKEEEKLTYFMDGDKKVLCTGGWYIYDLQTGKTVPDAYGTKPYIAFDCGGYVKFVKDDKTVVTALADGTVISNDVIHLQNGHYADPAENAVYDIEGNRLFTYDPNGFVPFESKNVVGYVVGKKTVDGKDRYVLYDESGAVASAEFGSMPRVHGELLFAEGKLVKFDGTVVLDGNYILSYWESKYGQLWVVDNGKIRKAVDKNGTVIYEGNATAPVLDLRHKVCYTTVDNKRMFYSVKDKNFSVGGVCLSPFIVKTADGATNYKLVNLLSGDTILSGHMNYTVADPGNSLLYVYAQVSDTEYEVYVVK